MRPGRFALIHLVFGAWLMISGATIAGAVLAFRSAPSAAEAATPAESPRRARAVAMRFNAEMFQASAKAQLVLAGLAVVLACWPPLPPRGAIACVLGAALLASVLALIITPHSATIAESRILALESGRLDPPDSNQANTFKALHRAHGACDLLKSLLVLGASFSLVKGQGRRET